jgi:hypothetical protein
MTLARQTWRMSAAYGFTPAGATPTVAEYIAAIKTMIDAEAAGSGTWMVSDYHASNGWLELKRKGSPTGILATARILIFGGHIPHAAAVAPTTTAGWLLSANVYMGVCEDANSTGPDASYASGSPYPGKKWTGGFRMFQSESTNLAKSRSCFTQLVDCDTMLSILVSDNTYGRIATAGEIVQLLDGTSGWGAVKDYNSSDTEKTGNLSYASTNVEASVPTAHGSGHTITCCGTWWNNNASAKNCLSAVMMALNSSYTLTDPLYSTGQGILMPVPIGTNDFSTAPTSSAQVVGILRQMKIGPTAINRLSIRDNLNVEQALHVNAGVSKIGMGLYFDQNL